MTAPAIHSIPAERRHARVLPAVLTDKASLIVAVIAFACAVAAWLRIPSIARNTLWAEDGRNFLQDAVNHGPFASLAIPYAGYLHTIPRIVASVTVTFVPVAQWADAMTAGSCLVAGILAAVVYVCTRDVVPWLPGRILIAGLTVLAPLAPREVLGNAANLHSLVLWTVFWMLLYTPRTRTGSIVLGAVAFLGAATEIQCLLLLPLALIRWRERRRWPILGGLAAGLTMQLFVTLLWPRPQSGHPPVETLSIAYGYLINAVMPLVTPQNAIGPVLASTGPAVGLVVLTAIAGAHAYVMIRGGTIQRIAAAGLVAASIGVYSASVLSNPNTFYDYVRFDRAQLEQVWLARYGVVPSMMLAAIVVLAVALAVSRRTVGTAKGLLGERRRRITGSVALAVVAALLLMQFVPQDTRRSAGPQWSPQVTAAARACERLPDDYVFHLRETITWHVWLSCRTLDPPGA
ncbi:hypothetical protein G3T36_10225 [Diaminobutyricibacter tongyongensis]|uniref:Uncharacterized protein n=1 Tax=Leifsonia tongyongensis TaxID=1268043 RepID=A0A6L9XXU2_9MICO|nr:hypothetical protein [Diaminobutyricibacter tongyongensis]NEN06252.1 hypothetical protein [Diaminobutyricibacter tongyongensis]